MPNDKSFRQGLIAVDSHKSRQSSVLAPESEVSAGASIALVRTGLPHAQQLTSASVVVLGCTVQGRTSHQELVIAASYYFGQEQTWGNRTWRGRDMLQPFIGYQQAVFRLLEEA